MKTIIAINGAPRSGKDTLGNFLKLEVERHGKTAEIHKCADPLDTIAKATLGMDDETFAMYREEKKDVKLPNQFSDRSMRDVLIAISEDFAKPLFGQDFFGRAAVDRINKSDCDVAIITDTGFQAEYDIVKDLADGDTVLINIQRDGCSFDNDSREYVADLWSLNVPNNGPEADLRLIAREILMTLLLVDSNAS